MRVRAWGVSLLLAVLLMAARTAAVAQSTTYLILDLGSLGNFYNHLLKVNANGHAVGWDQYHGMLWTPEAGLTQLAVGESSIARSLNAAGTIVGGYRDASVPSGFSRTGATVTTLPSPLVDAFDVNGSGQIVGTGIDGGYEQAFLLGTDGSLTPLGTLGGTWSRPNGINGAGDVVGLSPASDGSGGAFLYHNGVMQSLGTPGSPVSVANGINDLVQVVGVMPSTLRDRYGQYIPHAYLWQNGAIQDLTPTLAVATTALAINNKSQVVGYYKSGAALWQNGQWKSLNGLIPKNSGYRLDEARSINDDGVIACLGVHVGFTPAVPALLLVPSDIASVRFSPSTVPGSLPTTATLKLAAPAPYDFVAEITSDNAVAVTPATVPVPKGATMVSFGVSTSAVATSQICRIEAKLTWPSGTAKVIGRTVGANLTVRPIGVKTLKLSPSRVKGTTSTVGTVTLEAAAGPGDIVVTLSSNNPGVAAPTVADVTIPAGAVTGTFTVGTSAVSTSTVVQIKATANGISKATNLTVVP